MSSINVWSGSGMRREDKSVAPPLCRRVFSGVYGIFIAFLLFISGSASLGWAQNYPSRPVRIVVPLAPGGAADIIARALAQKLSEQLGQTFVVDNRAGAAGSIAYDIVAKSSPDAYTVAFVTGSMITSQLLSKAVPFDVRRDFAAVSQVSTQPYIFVVNTSLPVRNMSELIALAKAQPQRLSFASSGVGGLIHLTGELFKMAAGVQMVHVPYKGMATAYPDVISGRVPLAISALLSASAHIKTGKLRVIGVTSLTRFPALPEVPTVAESGLPGFEVAQWYGIMAPKATLAARVERLNESIAKALLWPEIVARLELDGSQAKSSTPAAFNALIKSEWIKWEKVIKTAGVGPEAS